MALGRMRGKQDLQGYEAGSGDGMLRVVLQELRGYSRYACPHNLVMCSRCMRSECKQGLLGPLGRDSLRNPHHHISDTVSTMQIFVR